MWIRNAFSSYFLYKIVHTQLLRVNKLYLSYTYMLFGNFISNFKTMSNVLFYTQNGV